MIAQTVLDYLAELRLEYQTVTHPHSDSSAETAVAAHVAEDHMAKGVLVRGEEATYMVVISADKWVDLHRLRDEFHQVFELAPESEVDTLFHDCVPGAVPPLGFLYGLETLLDEDLTMLSRVYIEAGDHEHLLLLQNDQFQILMGGVRHGHFSQSD